MNKLRCFLFSCLLVTSSSTIVFGGEIQTPGKSDPPPTPTPTAITTASTSDDLTQPTSTGQDQIVWPDATMLVEILLTVF